jgi:threonine dehydrogenase-like Zn-dependent dehydrogenase
MKAVVISKPQDLRVLDIETPCFGDDEVLIKSRAVGICHSDYELIDGKYIIPFGYPVTPGHEWAGDIAAVGKNVKSFKPGDRVVGECVINGGRDHFGFSVNGADAEYFLARPEWLHKLPDAVSYGTGSLVEPFTVGYYAIMVQGGTNASETVVVSGGGNIGLCTAAAAKGMGATVILIDPLPLRQEVAKKLGIDYIVNPSNEDAVQKVLALTEGKGADLVVEASGHAASLASVFDYAREFGRVSMVGISIGKDISVDLGKIQIKSLTVKGCVGSPNIWPQALQFLATAKTNLSPIRTHEYKLADAEAAFAFAKDYSRCIKVTLIND